MISPRILLTTYHEAFLYKGGGEFEIHQIATNLKKVGYVADIYSPYSLNLDNYDIVMHFSIHGGGLRLLEYIKSKKKPIILFPNFFKNSELDQQQIADCHRFTDIADMVIFKSHYLKNHFLSSFGIDDNPDKFVITNYSVNDEIINPAPADIFKSIFKLDKYALSLGIAEPLKNQMSSVVACKELGLHLVNVGKFRDKEYFQQCMDMCDKNCTFIDSLPYHSDIMRSALQQCAVYIEVSLEPPGISAIEAGLSGCRLVLSDSEWTDEIFGEHCIKVNPLSIDSIIAGIKKAMSAETDREAVRQHLTKHLIKNSINNLIVIINKVFLANFEQKAGR
ncbi:MAG: mannosyltransferase [Deferribacterales bacterium]